VERALAFVIGLVLACDLVVLGVHALDDNTRLFRSAPNGPSDTTVRIVPGEGQAFVQGRVDRVVADGARPGPLTVPVTLTAVERGVGRVTIEQALVAGRRQTISWDGGVPLGISGSGGSGGIDVGATHVEIDAEAITISIDGAPRPLLPGTYRLSAPVAVGTGGLATPLGGVEFTADQRTVINARGAVVTRLDPRRIEFLGPGRLEVRGSLQVQFPDGGRAATRVTLADGPYRFTVLPGPEGVTVDAVLQGEVTAA
jgi:hypothetical protein